MRYPDNLAYATGDPSMLTGIRGNRARLDSGTSASSESSRGSGKPPRRRSHRPRGCRGGSNRRRNNAESGKKNFSNKGGQNNNSNKGNLDGKSKPKTILTKLHKGNKSISKESEPFSFQTGRATMNSGYFTEFGHPELQRGSSVTTISTDLSSSSASFDYAANRQRSFSDSSSEVIPDPAVMLRTGDQILPPLPSRATRSEPTPCGPNPYALKLANHNNINVHSNSLNIHTNHKLMGGYETPVKDFSATFYPSHQHQQCHLENIPNNIINSGNNAHNFATNGHNTRNMGPPPPRRPSNLQLAIGNPTEDHYRAERLEIQRQTMVGGSLFATSPRSFLMGKRTTSGDCAH